jgi:hypothetical protein
MSLSGMLKGSKSKTAGASSTSTTTKLFSDEILKALEDMYLEELDIYERNRGYSSELAKRVMTENTYDVEPIISENERAALEDLGQTYQNLARQTGSDANSLTALAYSDAVSTTRSKLASTEAQLKMNAQSQQIQDLGNALSAQSAAQSGILGLGNLLKGANATGTSNTKSNKRTSSLEWGLSSKTDNGSEMFSGLFGGQ